MCEGHKEVVVLLDAELVRVQRVEEVGLDAHQCRTRPPHVQEHVQELRVYTKTFTHGDVGVCFVFSTTIRTK